MEKILKNQEEEIAFQWRGNSENPDIKKAIELKIAFIMPGMSDDTTLWVKTGEYEAAAKETIARVKYQNVPMDYWIVISDCIEKDNEIKHVKKVKIIKDKKFSSKYHILNDEPTLFDNEENETEEDKHLKGELKEAVQNFSDKTGIKVEVC
ncbi:hypothetical protein [Brachyspira alvinipulli]|uniref:hypothetical protein n=1 Tax=Brachyspira alvinipulli TaxID=84379 RepID=UPI000487BC07|nr:hypothetical protein [Brachyspira alvinipulli]